MSGSVSRDVVLGREHELGVLAAAQAAARSGDPRIVLVDAPAGMGKSTLLRLFIAAHEGLRVLDASGDEPEQATSYGVVEQLLRTSPILPEDLRDTIAHPPLADPPTVGAALVDLLGKLAADTSVAVVLDDLHWVDSASLQALGFVLHRLRGESVLTLMTVRTDLLHRLPRGLLTLAEGTRGVRLTLTGLAAGQLRELGQHVGHEALSAAAARRLHRHTDGNPLHARALLEELTHDQLETDSGDAPLPAPRTFGELVVERLAGCPADSRRLVDAAAVLGPITALSTAAELAEVTTAPLAALQTAVDARLVTSYRSAHGTQVAFPHMLIRAAVYHALGPARVAELHLRAATLVDGEGASLRHRAAAAELDAGLGDACEAFAEREASRGDWPSAATALLQASRVSPTRHHRERRLLDAIECLMLAGDATAVTELAATLHELTDGPHLRYVRGQLQLMVGDWSHGRELLESAWATHDHDPHLGGRIAGAMTNLFVNLGHGDEAVTWARRAIDLVGPTARLRGELSSMLLVALALHGSTEEGLTIAEPLLADHTLTPVERAGALMGRGLLHLWSGGTEAAADDLGRAYAAARTTGPFHTAQIARFYLADAEYRRGRWDAAIAHAEASVSATAAAGQTWFAALVHAVASFPLSARGDVGAESHVRAATAAAAAIGHAGAHAFAATAAARLAHARDDHRGVLDAVVQLTSRLHDLGLPPEQNPCIQPWALLEAEARVRTGDVAGAGALLEWLSDGESRPTVLLELWRLRGLVAAHAGQREAADEAFHTGLAQAKHMTAPFARALLLLDHGAFLRRVGQRRAARERLDPAGEILEQLGAEPYLVRCEREQRASGGPGQRHRGDPHQLTPQEHAVVELVAGGATNREVAAHLHLSVKAVEYHLGNVYRKLGLRSRAELAARVAAEGRLG